MIDEATAFAILINKKANDNKNEAKNIKSNNLTNNNREKPNIEII